MDDKKHLKTIKRSDIAHEAGVSETVVSYVINGNRYVNAEKKKRVEEAIAKLKYRPNSMARALKGKKSNHILFVADDIQGEYFGKLISEIDSLAYKEGYFITLCADHNDEDFVNRIYSKFFDGIVIGSAAFPVKNIQRLVNTGVPVVLLEIRDYSTVEGVYGLINTGLYEGARQCVRQLYQKGRRRLLFLDRLSKDGKGSNLDDWRLKGFCDQLEEYGLILSDANILSGCATEEELTRKLGEKIDAGFVPDGVFGRNDHIALVGMEALKDKGFSIPQDVSVIGFDNSRMCRFARPALSSMEIQQKELAKSVMSMIINLIDRPGEYSQRLEEHLKTQLVMRESV